MLKTVGVFFTKIRVNGKLKITSL